MAIHDRSTTGHLEGSQWLDLVHCFSPDGQTIASGSFDSSVLWDATTGQCLTHRVIQVGFGPFSVQMGKCLPVGDDTSVRLWDIKTGQCLNTLQGHSSQVHAVAFSPQGHILASGSDDASLRLWDTKTRQCLSTLGGTPVTSIQSLLVQMVKP